MSAIREQIFARIEQMLTVAGIAVEVERMPSADPARLPALHIFDGGDQMDTGEAGTDRWIMTVEIEGTVEAASGAAAHAAMHALDTGLIETLYREPVLAGLASEIQAGGIRPMVAERASRRRIGFTRTFSIHYATRRGSPQVID